MKTALVLGASGTLGGAIARELSARGYAAGLHYCIHRERCEALAADIQAARTDVRTACYGADFLDPAAAQNLVAAFLKDFGRLDGLFWAAGIMRDAPLAALPEDDMRAVLNVDLKAFFLTLKACARQFMKQKSGAVLALSSHAALAGRAGGSAYAMAHGGLLGLVKSTAREWGPLGVRVNAVLPPFVQDSGMGRAASAEFVQSVNARRVLKPASAGAANLARFALDVSENEGISGQVLSADCRILAG